MASYTAYVIILWPKIHTATFKSRRFFYCIAYIESEHQLMTSSIFE